MEDPNILLMSLKYGTKGIHRAGRQTGDESCKADAHLTPDADVPEALQTKFQE